VTFKNNPPILENYIKIILVVLADPKLPMLAKDFTNLSEFAVDTPCSMRRKIDNGGGEYLFGAGSG
jgi:hypothetical protein